MPKITIFEEKGEPIEAGNRTCYLPLTSREPLSRLTAKPTHGRYTPMNHKLENEINTVCRLIRTTDSLRHTQYPTTYRYSQWDVQPG